MRDKQGGLPSFLRHNFVGNSRQQLLIGLEHAGILTQEEIKEVVHFSKLIQASPPKLWRLWYGKWRYVEVIILFHLRLIMMLFWGRERSRRKAKLVLWRGQRGRVAGGCVDACHYWGFEVSAWSYEMVEIPSGVIANKIKNVDRKTNHSQTLFCL